MEKKIREIHETFMTILKKPEMEILPGQIAFYFLMSIVPIIVISAIAASFITKSFDFAKKPKSPPANSPSKTAMQMQAGKTIKGAIPKKSKSPGVV